MVRLPEGGRRDAVMREMKDNGVKIEDTGGEEKIGN